MLSALLRNIANQVKNEHNRKVSDFIDFSRLCITTSIPMIFGQVLYDLYSDLNIVNRWACFYVIYFLLSLKDSPDACTPHSECFLFLEVDVEVNEIST